MSTEILLLYCVNSFWLKSLVSGSVGYFLRCHFNDLCAGFFIMAYINLVLRPKRMAIKGLVPVLLVCLAAGSVWEFFAPLINTRSTTDYIDLVRYIAGGFLYWVIRRMER